MARDGIGSDIVDLVKYFQVNVKFDPNTAHMSLSVSKDLMSVRWKERWNNIEQQDNFQKDPCILGSVTIKSGKISWLLKIGKTRYFSFGWAKKSLDKTEKLTLKPEEGIWALSVGADGMKALDDPPVQVCCNSTLNKVWVYLDYDAGHLSFYNDSQNPLFRKTGLDLLYAFSHRFDEPVRPFFWIRNQDHDLTLLPP
ncbi:E3 ubiquitin-protein ligase TRIM58-like [Discoglossus pictus]